MRTGRSRNAFTLVELLVAAAITVLLAGLMLGITSNVLNTWNRSSGELKAGQQARRVFDQIEQDLRGAILRADGPVWLAVTVQPDQSGTGDAGMANASWSAGSGGRMKPGNAPAGDANSSLNLAPASGRLEDCRGGMAGMWLRFFTVQPAANDGTVQNTSSPRAVAYQIVRLRASGQSTAYHYNLYRSQVRAGGSANSTFTLGYDLFAPVANNPGYNRGDGTEQNAGNIRRPNASQLIANNVIDFGVRCFNQDAEGRSVLLFPAAADNLGLAATTNGAALPPAPGGYAGHMSYGFPRVVEVFLRVLTDDGARQIALFENPPAGGTIISGETWWDFALAHSQVYTRRFEIRAGPW